MRKFGFVEAGLISEDNVIASGNARQETAVNIGLDDVQIIDIDGTKPVYLRKKGLKSGTPEFHELALALNQVGQKNVVMDAELIEATLGEAVCEEWGVELPENEVTEDGFDAEPPLKPITVLGDLYELDGKHRVLCGDSTDSDTVAKLMDGKKADMVFTDVPYGIDYSGGRTQVVKKKTYGKLMNDDLQGEELGNLLANVFLFNKAEADVYVCVSPIKQKPFIEFIENSGKIIDAVIVWDKKQPGLGYMKYRRQCEFILFVKGGDFKKGEKSDFDLWQIGRDNGKDYSHGTQKPIALPARAINNSSKKDDLVLDYFLGSGSTLMACEQADRICYGQELDAPHIDLIVARYCKFKQSQSAETAISIRRNGKELSPKDIQKYLAQIEPKEPK